MSAKFKEAIQLQKLLEEKHSKDLDPILNYVLEHLTNPSNRYKIKINYTSRGMGYDLQRPHSENFIIRGDGELGMYVIFVDDIPFYTGEGYIWVRISRFVKAVLGEQRSDENHKAGEWINKHIDENKFNPSLLDRFYVAFIPVTQIKKMYESVNLNFYSSLMDENFDTKEHIENISKIYKFNKYKPITYYFEKHIMNKIGSILNTNNQNLSDIKFINEKKFWEKGFVSRAYN